MSLTLGKEYSPLRRERGTTVTEGQPGAKYWAGGLQICFIPQTQKAPGELSPLASPSSQLCNKHTLGLPFIVIKLIAHQPKHMSLQTMNNF